MLSFLIPFRCGHLQLVTQTFKKIISPLAAAYYDLFRTELSSILSEIRSVENYTGRYEVFYTKGCPCARAIDAVK